MPPAPRPRSAPPPPLRRATPRSVLLSRAVILLVAGLCGLRIIALSAPSFVVGAALLLLAAAAVALLRVDWESYWFTMPGRLKATVQVAGFFGGIGALILAASTIALWYAYVSWNAKNDVAAIFLFLFGGAGMFYVVAGGLGGVFGILYALLINNEKKPDGRRMVEGQDVHGAADFASTASIDSALKGSNAAAARPRKFED